MEFTFSAEQDELRAAVRSTLAKEAGSGVLWVKRRPQPYRA